MALTYIQVGTWNIEHLGRQFSENERKLSVYALTDHIEMSGIDILALQEVYVTHLENGIRKNEFLDKTCYYLKEHTNFEWDYLILENKRANDTSQLCGILWNNSLISHNRTVEIPVDFRVDDLSLWDRKPHAVKFKTREKILNEYRNFILVPLHMKANTGDRNDKLKRELEAKELIQQVPWIISQLGDESLIMLGDTNCLGAWEKAITIITEGGFQDLNNQDEVTFVRGKAPFDRFFVRVDRPEFEYSRQYILKSANSYAHDQYLSDHYLIKTSIKIYVDED